MGLCFVKRRNTLSKSVPRSWLSNLMKFRNLTLEQAVACMRFAKLVTIISHFWSSAEILRRVQFACVEAPKTFSTRSREICKMPCKLFETLFMTHACCLVVARQNWLLPLPLARVLSRLMVSRDSLMPRLRVLWRSYPELLRKTADQM